VQRQLRNLSARVLESYLGVKASSINVNTTTDNHDCSSLLLCRFVDFDTS
jgi:hypothetical protein